MDGRQLAAIGILGAGAWWLWSRSTGTLQAATLPPGTVYGGQQAALPMVGYVSPQQAAMAAQRSPQGQQLALPPGQGGAVATQAALGVGTGVATAAIAGSSLVAGALTAGIGAVVTLFAWGIGEKGWFRGGEEGVKVNPARDQLLAAWGPSGEASKGIPWEQTGAHKLAVDLSTMTGEPGGGRLWKAVMEAQSMEQFRDAVLGIQAEYAKHGITI